MRPNSPQDLTGRPNVEDSNLVATPLSNAQSLTKSDSIVTHQHVSVPPGPVNPDKPSARHTYMRLLVAVFIPSCVAAYYGYIWIQLILRTPNDETVKYRTINGSVIFYFWFFIAIFVLSWSNYGLVGIETAILKNPSFWAVPSEIAQQAHDDHSWNSPSGWWAASSGWRHHIFDKFTSLTWWRSVFQCVWHVDLVRPSWWRKSAEGIVFWRLWLLLAFISVLPFVAIPLSGLVFELTDGYVLVKDKPTLVQGRNSTTFNSRYDRGLTMAEPWRHAWLVGAAPVIPGLGIIYTNANASVERSSHPSFNKLPNTLPDTNPAPDLFLAPQAETPISGRTWGLRIKYDCSVVRSASEFKILSEKPRSSLGRSCDEPCYGLETPSGDLINLKNSSQILAVSNVQAYYEIGWRRVTHNTYHGEDPDFEPGEDDSSMVIELAAWQYRTTHPTFDDLKFPFNASVGTSVEGMSAPFFKRDNGSYAVNETFFALDGASPGESSTDPSRLVQNYKDYNEYYRVVDVAPPIGVRCVASSGLGAATLDGVTSTFDGYERQDPEVDPVYQYGPYRFGGSALSILQNEIWFQYYIAGGLTGTQPDQNGNRFPQFIDSMSLLRSVNLAFALDAFDLMYGVTSGYRGKWEDPGLELSEEGKILVVASLVSGSATGWLVFSLLVLWAVMSAGFGLYGLWALFEEGRLKKSLPL